MLIPHIMPWGIEFECTKVNPTLADCEACGDCMDVEGGEE